MGCPFGLMFKDAGKYAGFSFSGRRILGKGRLGGYYVRYDVGGRRGPLFFFE